MTTTDAIADILTRQFTDLIAQNAAQIAQELADNPEGKLSVGMTFKLISILDTSIHCQSKLRFIRKFEDEAEDKIDLKKVA
jgi:hypothetical protein